MRVLEGSGYSFAALIQLLASFGRTGSVRVLSKGWRGLLLVDSGVVIAASMEGEQGIAALESMALALSGGQFEFSDGLVNVESNLPLNAEGVRACVQAVESKRLAERCEVPLAVAVPTLNEDSSGTDESRYMLSRHTISVLLAVDGRRTVREIAARHGLAASLLALGQLAELGLIATETPEPNTDFAPPNGSPTASPSRSVGANLVKLGAPATLQPIHHPPSGQSTQVTEPDPPMCTAGPEAEARMHTAWPRWLWPAGIIAWSMFALLVFLADVAWPIRPPVEVGFLLTCPGMAFVRLLRLQQPIATWTLGTALSLALDTLVAMVMAYTRTWSPQAGVSLLVCLSVTGAVLDLWLSVDWRRGHSMSPGRQ